MRQQSGYAIVMKPNILLTRYLRVHVTEKNRKRYISELRDALHFLNPASYRGISRDHLWAYPSRDKKFFKDFGPENQKARLRMLDFVENYLYPEFDNGLLGSLEQALELYNLLDKKDHFEIVILARESFTETDKTLGYDIGYWGGDHFSIICDSAIMPMWHPPHPKDFGGLAERFKKLNRHLLFENESDARDFREYYKSFDWAEKEMHDGQFCIIQVTEVFIERSR